MQIEDAGNHLDRDSVDAPCSGDVAPPMIHLSLPQRWPHRPVSTGIYKEALHTFGFWMGGIAGCAASTWLAYLAYVQTRQLDIPAIFLLGAVPVGCAIGFGAGSLAAKRVLASMGGWLDDVFATRADAAVLLDDELFHFGVAFRPGNRWPS